MGKNDGGKSKNEVYKILQIMPQYIDKDALVAEIERRRDLHFKNYIEKGFESSEGKYDEDKYILSFLDTTEVKEMDLKKEFSQWWKVEKAKDYNVDILYERYPNVSMKLAKHFFELGLNTQQNISINVTDIDKVIEKNGVDPNSKEAKMFKESYYMALEKLKTTKGE